MRRQVLALFATSAIVLGGAGGVFASRTADARQAEQRSNEVTAAERHIVRLQNRAEALRERSSALEDEIDAVNDKNRAAAQRVRDQHRRIERLRAELAALSA